VCVCVCEFGVYILEDVVGAAGLVWHVWEVWTPVHVQVSCG